MDSLFPDAYQFYLDPAFSEMEFTDLPNLPDFSQILSTPFQLNNEPPAKRRTRIRAAKACLACRSRHMKCDSVEPKCTKCQLDGKTCVYTKSRRGGSHKLDSPNESSSAQGTSTASSGRTPVLDTDSGSLESLGSALAIDNSIFSDVRKNTSSSEPQEHDMISLFYEYFYPAHPFVLPRAYLLSRQKSNPSSVEHLIPVLEYIGSKYDSDIDSDSYQQACDEALNTTNLPNNGFSVQALILCALARHCSDEYDLGDIFLDKAIDIGLSIGMERRDFAVLHGEGFTLLEESWRRTSWTLYMIDVTFAAVGHRPKHRLQNLHITVDLPCEDWDYEEGRIPIPRTLEEYNHREFLMEEETDFSSMTYLIDSIRISSSNMLTLNTPFCPGNRTITDADAKLVNWCLYLPKHKQDPVKRDGSVDETMFLAFNSISIQKILLHRPHSALAFSDAEARSKCTPPADLRQSREMQRSLILHTAKALEATSSAITIFALPAPILRHSPLTICSLALAIMSQVSACNHVLGLSETASTHEKVEMRAEAYELGRDRVRLGLGALKSAAHAWGMARRSVREVVGVSRELLAVDTLGGNPGVSNHSSKSVSPSRSLLL